MAEKYYRVFIENIEIIKTVGKGRRLDAVGVGWGCSNGVGKSDSSDSRELFLGNWCACLVQPKDGLKTHFYEKLISDLF